MDLEAQLRYRPATVTPSKQISFGPFVYEPNSGRLTKYGQRIKLQQKSSKILSRLLEEPGRVVSRNDIERELWPEGTYVDYELGTRVALKKLRDALGDSAEEPRYIETVRGEGYRFVGAVETQAPASGGAVTSSSQTEAGTTDDVVDARAASLSARTGNWAVAMISGAVLMLLLIATIAARVAFRPETREQPRVERLTSSGATTAAISPDGRYLAYATDEGIWLKQIASGDVHRLQVEPGLAPFDLSWYRDSSSLLALDAKGVWRLSILGGAAQQIFGPARAAAISPDGKRLAVTSPDARSILVAGSNGENPRVIAAIVTPGTAYMSRPAWSPHGARVAYMKHWEEAGAMTADIETAHPDGTDVRVVLKRFPIMQLAWMEDGRVLFGVGNPAPNLGTTNLWSVPVREETGEAASPAEPLTNWPDFNFLNPSSTSDGHTVVFTRMVLQVNVSTAELGPDAIGPLKALTSEAAYSYNHPGTWDPSGKDLIVVVGGGKNPSIRRQPVDGGQPQAIVPASLKDEIDPQVSADGRWLLWIRTETDASAPGPVSGDSSRWQWAEVARMPREGGPVQILDRQAGLNFWLRCPSRSGAECVFGVLQRDYQLAFRGIDTDSGTSRELFRWTPGKAGASYDVAPTGDRIFLWENPAARGDRGKMWSANMDGGGKRELPIACADKVSGWSALPDGGWLLAHPTAPRGSEIVRVNSAGACKTIWRSDSERLGEPEISRDGRRIAVAVFSSDRNAWALHF
jgi:DNA-binding winged helix-turn-helix (wHTH) protein/Tol biopolymer transport system component